MPDSYKELIKSNPDETEIGSFLVNGDQVSVTLRIPDTLRDAAVFVLGGSQNGWTEWVSDDGETLNQVYRSEEN